MNQDGRYVSIEPEGGDTGTPLNLQKRLTLILRYIDIQDKKFIDCGCGTGDYVLALGSLGAEAWGIEYSKEKVSQFRNRKSHQDRVFVGDVQKIAFPDSSFDIAMLNEALEHIPNDVLALKEIYRILKPGGILIVFSPNRFYPFETHGVFLKGSTRRLPPYCPFVPYVPLAVGQKVFRYWARNYWPGELRGLITKVGFLITHTDYIWQTFENISGHQPFLITILKPLLRRLCSFLERLPLVKTFGVSQLVIAVKNTSACKFITQQSEG